MSDVMMKALQLQAESLTRQVEVLAPENERVRKLLDEFSKRHDADDARIEALEAQLAEATSAWNTRAAPKVKPLVWDGRKTDSVMFQYRVHIGYGQMSGVFALTLSGSTIGEFNSEEDAKAAAQEDYERRVLSALDL